MDNSTFEQLATKLDELNKEQEVIDNELYEIFRSKLSELDPVIEFMKKRRLKFSHPDLPEVYTSLGAILGRNSKTHREIYVYDGDSLVIKEVSLSDTNSFTDYKMSPFRFIQVCDLDFAFNGIEHTKNSVNLIIEEYQKGLNETKEFINKIKEA